MIVQSAHSSNGANKRSPKLTLGSMACLDPAGRHLYSVNGRQIETFTLDPTDPDGPIQRVHELRACEIIDALAIGPNGSPYIAMRSDGGSDIVLLQDRQLVSFAHLPARPQHLAVTDSHVVAVLPPSSGRSSRLVTIDRKSAGVDREIAISGVVSRVRASSGNRVVIVDRSAHSVRRLALSDRCCPEQGPSGPRHPEPDHCRPGDDGIDDDCWFTVVVGDHLIRINLCDPAAEQCQSNLLSRIDLIERVGSRLVAVTERGHALVEVDPETLTIMNRQHLRVPVARLLAASQAGTAVALDAAGQAVARILIPSGNGQSDATAAIGPATLVAEISEKVVEGTRFSVPDPEPQFAITPLNVLIVPMTEPGQSFAPASLDAYDDVMRNPAGPLGTDAPLAIIERYYAEQSNGQQPVTVDVFGATTPQFHVGAPVVLPDEFQSYYHPSFESGGIVMSPSLGSLPAEYRFTGAERRTIQVISAINITATEANATELELIFPAAIASFNLGSGLTVTIDSSGPPTHIAYLDRDGLVRTLVLDPSVLGADEVVEFDSSMNDFGPSIESLRSALQTIVDAADTENDIASINIRWVKTDASLGQLNVLFSFSNGSGPERPRINNFSGGATLESFLDLDEDAITLLPGFGLFDPAASDGINARSAAAESYFERVMLLAEAADSETGFVPERLLGSAQVDAVDNGGNVGLTIQLNVSTQHGGGDVATIIAGPGVGEDVIDFGSATSHTGSSHTYDQRNTLIDKEHFYEQVYGAMITAIDDLHGGLSADQWEQQIADLSTYDTIFALPVSPPPPGSGGLWTVSEANDTGRLRASVNSGLTISDPNGLAPAAPSRWGMQFMNFDDRVGSNSRTLAHEMGHSLKLSDQYLSSKFHPSLEYLGGLDLMGSSSADWPHFCAYHKLAMGWHGPADRMVIDRPNPGTTTERRFILGPVEWWDASLKGDFEDAFPDEAATVEATGSVLCDLGGDGSTLAIIEARCPGAEFSRGLGDETTGRVTVINALDLGVEGRYGQVLPDTENVPANVIKGFLRYRRRIHPVDRNMQPGDPTFDMATAPGFPVPGLEVQVVDQATIMLPGTDETGASVTRPVQVYVCTVSWTLGPTADLGFSDNADEWRSSDIGIDWTGSGGDEAGTTNWPVGQPSGVGDTVRIPASGEEPHEVMVRVWNFGNATAHEVEVELYLRDPGGGGDPAPHNLYDTITIPELAPESESEPIELRFPWSVPAGQEPHICWRAQIAGYQLGDGVSAAPAVLDAQVGNNWAQQNIFEADVVHSSPPEPIESRFSVHNDGAFIEHAYLEPRGLPPGVTMRIRPRLLRVPPFSTRHFRLRFEFDEEVVGDVCRRDMEFLVQCWRHEDHSVEPWGASLFKFKVGRKTETTVAGTWYGGQVNQLLLNGTVGPGFVVGDVALRLDFQNGEPAIWVDTPLSVGGVFDEVIDTTGIDQDNAVIVTATYRGSPQRAASTSAPTHVYALQPAG